MTEHLIEELEQSMEQSYFYQWQDLENSQTTAPIVLLGSCKLLTFEFMFIQLCTYFAQIQRRLHKKTILFFEVPIAIFK